MYGHNRNEPHQASVSAQRGRQNGAGRRRFITLRSVESADARGASVSFAINPNMKDKPQIVADRLPRYTGVPLDQFGHYILLTNFSGYLGHFARLTGAEVVG